MARTLEKKYFQLQAMLNEQEPQFEGLKQEVYRHEGALLILRKLATEPDYMKQFLANPNEAIQTGERDLVVLNQRLGQAACNVNHLKGEQSATNYYRRMYVWGVAEPHSKTEQFDWKA